MVCAVKHNDHHKARLAARGCLTETHVDSLCSSIVSLCQIRPLAFLAKLNDIEVWLLTLEMLASSPALKKRSQIQFKPWLCSAHHQGSSQSQKLWSRIAWLFFWCVTWNEIPPSKMQPAAWVSDCCNHHKCVSVCVNNLLIMGLMCSPHHRAASGWPCKTRKTCKTRFLSCNTPVHSGCQSQNASFNFMKAGIDGPGKCAKASLASPSQMVRLSTAHNAMNNWNTGCSRHDV